MRLTLELVANAEQVVGPNKGRIICLRGFRIPSIENLGATNDHFDIIDLTDNDMTQLDNFPTLKRLETLLVTNNRICRLDPDLADSLPNMKSLILTNNKMATLANLVPLFKANNLERLSLLDNPVISKQYYRSFLIHNIKSLRFLDFQHVKAAERIAAKALFSGEAGEALSIQLGSKPSEDVPIEQDEERQILDRIGSEDVSTASSHKPEVIKLTDEEINRLREAANKASTLAELHKFENALKTGILPDELMKDTDQNKDTNMS